MGAKVAIYSDTGIEKIPANTDAVLLVRPIKVKKLEKILKKCNSLKTIALSKSCNARLNEKAKRMVRDKGVELKIEKNAGRAISIDLEKMIKAIEMRKDFRPLREIEETTGIPKSTIHYLTKQSQRKKVKKGKDVIYLDL